MLLIKLSDNNYNGYKLSLTEYSEEEKETIRTTLDFISNISLPELEKQGVIIFPSKAAESELNNEKQTILSVQHLTTDTPTITTRNVMGFFSVNGVQIEISSRFDSGEKQFFLHYMLSKVCNVAPTFELINASKDKLYDFAPYLFPAFLKKAVSQGLFRMYITREYNDSNLRGVIDFPRHFRNNIPFNGKIAYRTREYSSDNFVTQLVRHTIEFIAENSSLRKILSLDDETRGAVQEICGNTGSYDRLSRNFIINKNLRPLSHPYYTEYEQLRKLCIMILTHDKISYGESQQNQINGILFDGASLWEEYLATILMPQGFKHPKNKERSGGIRMFANNNASDDPELIFDNFDKNYRKIYPDFYRFDDKENKDWNWILDAKYKKLDGCKVQREDLYQIVTYMHTMNIEKGGFIYPSDSTTDSNLNPKQWNLAGLGGTIHVCGMQIPINKDNFQDFCEEMKKQEDSLLHFS